MNVARNVAVRLQTAGEWGFVAALKDRRALMRGMSVAILVPLFVYVATAVKQSLEPKQVTSLEIAESALNDPGMRRFFTPVISVAVVPRSFTYSNRSAAILEEASEVAAGYGESLKFFEKNALWHRDSEDPWVAAARAITAVQQHFPDRLATEKEYAGRNKIALAELIGAKPWSCIAGATPSRTQLWEELALASNSTIEWRTVLATNSDLLQVYTQNVRESCQLSHGMYESEFSRKVRFIVDTDRTLLLSRAERATLGMPTEATMPAVAMWERQFQGLPGEPPPWSSVLRSFKEYHRERQRTYRRSN